LKLERLLAAAERAADWEEVSRLCSQVRREGWPGQLLTSLPAGEEAGGAGQV